MNAKDFVRLGVPLGEASRRATDFISKFILGGGDKSRLHEEVSANHREDGRIRIEHRCRREWRSESERGRKRGWTLCTPDDFILEVEAGCSVSLFEQWRNKAANNTTCRK